MHSVSGVILYWNVKFLGIQFNPTQTGLFGATKDWGDGVNFTRGH